MRKWLLRIAGLLLLGLLGDTLAHGGVDSARAQARDFTVKITTPAEGETFYAGPTSMLYHIPIAGWVDDPDYTPADVEIQLSILQDGELAGSQTTTPLADGTFDFYVTVNPDYSQSLFLNNESVVNPSCADRCHHPTKLGLPRGAVVLRVTATDPAGQSGSVERHIVVDRSSFATVPVRVIHADRPEKPVPDVPVRASTRLYLWRTRHAAAASDARGYANMRVEALAEAPTRYVLQVEPTVVDGVLYASVEPVELVLPPGATSASPVTLKVRSRMGEIAGTLAQADGRPLGSVPVYAIRLPDGDSRRTDTSEDGVFSFSNLPIDRYLLAPDPTVLMEQGLRGLTREVDLVDVVNPSVELAADSMNSAIQGIIVDGDGVPLPFAWVRAGELGEPQAVLPHSGTYTLSGLPAESITIFANAPGFYSRAQVVDPSSKARPGVDIALTRQPGTHSLPWGNGEIVIPAETQLTRDERVITLERGWLWGRGHGSDAITINAAAVEIVLLNADFALEYLPGQRAWLYVFEGQAKVRAPDDPEPTVVRAGSMINLLDGDRVPATLNPVVVSALQKDSIQPLSLVWELSLRARVRRGLAQAGIGAAQIVSLVTYSAAIALLILVPVAGVLWKWKRFAVLSWIVKKGQNKNDG